jgi:2-polyprenyl-3-methyl-5-hydroxy-6-metoxy-1,4-benzoquinol methylase
MLRDLEKRRQFWADRPRYGYCDTTVQGLPFLGHEDVFRGKHVLEIGPGGGMQSEVIRPLASYYAVADISPEVLLRFSESFCPTYRLEDYKGDLHHHFDVITFWYVIHHVLVEERTDFLMFLLRHLNPGGCLFFNTPDEGHPNLGDDGVWTSPHTAAEIRILLEYHGLSVELERRDAVDSVVFLARSG